MGSDTGWDYDVTPDPSGACRSGSRASLSRRLLVASVLVSAISVLTFGALDMYAVSAGLSQLTATERHTTTVGVEQETSAAYRAAGGWRGADLSRAERAAWAVGARVTFTDVTGRYLDGAIPSKRYLAGSESTTLPVGVDGQQVGNVRIWFSGDAWAARSARTLLWHWGVIALLVSMLVAGTASFVLSRRLIAPLRRLAEVSERFRRGDRTARSGHHDAPGEIGCLAAVLDESMEVIADEDAARRRMTADIAHEIRTPLAALQAGLEELRDGHLAPTPDRLADLHDAVLRLGRVVGDLSDLASAESARLSLDRSVIDLAEVTRREVADKEALIRAAGLVLDTTLRPACVIGDADRLRVVVGNLLVNAARYCSPGDGLRVTTETRRTTAYLTVTDAGPGIPPADLPHVFDRLYRGANASEVRGSGIGLAIVRELVEAHEGLVTITSPPAGGTTVSVALPQCDHPPGPAASAPITDSSRPDRVAVRPLEPMATRSVPIRS
jgi:two-component system, OmpR family, sensor histidine kinase BaeS